MHFLLTEEIFRLSKIANCSALDIFNADVDIFFQMVAFHFESMRIEKEGQEEQADSAASGGDDFWNF